MDMQSTNYQTVAAWRAALRSFMHASKAILKRNGITSMQYQALLAIRTESGSNGLAIKGLAAYLGIKHNSAVDLANNLEEGGYIKRVRSPHDRRVACLHLTAAGSEILETLVNAHQGEIRRIRPQMSLVLASL